MHRGPAPIATISQERATLARAGGINATESMFTFRLTFNGSVNRPFVAKEPTKTSYTVTKVNSSQTIATSSVAYNGYAVHFNATSHFVHYLFHSLQVESCAA